MRGENGIQVDFNALEEVLRRADVLTIGFTLFPERLLVDLRMSAAEEQFAGIVEPVASVQDRYLWLGQNRGTFGAPEAFSFFVWPWTVQSLAGGDVLRTLRDRFAPAGLRQFEDALRRALELETRAILDAVKGEQTWPAIWEAHPTNRLERQEP